MQEIFFRAFAEELSKLAMCGKSHGKKAKTKGTAYASKMDKKAEKMVYCPRRKKMIPASEMGKKASAITAKIEAARRDPSTKANPKDTGPPGSGTQDPRFKAMKKRAAMQEILKNAAGKGPNLITAKARRARKVVDPQNLPRVRTPQSKIPSAPNIRAEGGRFFEDIKLRNMQA